MKTTNTTLCIALLFGILSLTGCKTSAPTNAPAQATAETQQTAQDQAKREGVETYDEVTMKLGNPEITGSLDKRIIQKFVKQYSSELRGCYENALSANSDLQGNNTATMTIDKTGSISNVEVEIDNAIAGAESIKTCMMEKIKLWKFPSPKDFADVKVVYPFVFKHIKFDYKTVEFALDHNTAAKMKQCLTDGDGKSLFTDKLEATRIVNPNGDTFSLSFSADLENEIETCIGSALKEIKYTSDEAGLSTKLKIQINPLPETTNAFDDVIDQNLDAIKACNSQKAQVTQYEIGCVIDTQGVCNEPSATILTHEEVDTDSMRKCMTEKLQTLKFAPAMPNTSVSCSKLVFEE